MCRVAARRPNVRTGPIRKSNIDEVDLQENTYEDEDCLGNNNIAIVVIDQSVKKSKVVLFRG